jgi:hypothetical protein
LRCKGCAGGNLPSPPPQLLSGGSGLGCRSVGIIWRYRFPLGVGIVRTLFFGKEPILWGSTDAFEQGISRCRKKPEPLRSGIEAARCPMMLARSEGGPNTYVRCLIDTFACVMRNRARLGGPVFLRRDGMAGPVRFIFRHTQQGSEGCTCALVSSR